MKLSGDYWQCSCFSNITISYSSHNNELKSLKLDTIRVISQSCCMSIKTEFGSYRVKETVCGVPWLRGGQLGSSPTERERRQMLWQTLVADWSVYNTVQLAVCTLSKYLGSKGDWAYNFCSSEFFFICINSWGIPCDSGASEKSDKIEFLHASNRPLQTLSCGAWPEQRGEGMCW